MGGKIRENIDLKYFGIWCPLWETLVHIAADITLTFTSCLKAISGT